MARGARRRRAQRRRRARRSELLEALLDRRARGAASRSRRAQHAVRQHDPARAARRRSPATRSSSTGSARSIRWNAIAMVLQRQQGVLRARRPHRQPTSRRRRSTRSASTTSGTRRPTSTAATSSTSRATRRRASTRARSSRAGSTEEQLRGFRQEVGGGGLSLLPAPVADAGLLAVPDGLDGPRPADGDLPGALHEVPRRAATSPRPPAARCGRSWATARWTSRSRWARSRSPAASTSTTSIFVINCNLQRLDGPVRGNGKIIQELETDFRGAGWNVIKVIWGARWDPLLAADHDGPARAADGGGRRRRLPDLQVARRRLRARALLRRRTPSCARWSSDMTDDEIWRAQPRRPRPAEGLRRLRRGRRAHQGQPTVILAKTIKGYGMGEAGEGQNITHQQKKMNEEALLAFRDRFDLDLTDEEVREVALPQAARRRAGDELPARAPRGARRQRCRSARAERRRRSRCPELDGVQGPARGHRRARDLDDDGVRAHPRRRCCATRSSARASCRSSPTSRARSAWRGMFRQLGIFSQVGQLYQPRGRRAADVLPRGQARPDPPGGDQRAGRVLVVDRRGDLVRQPRRADGPVLHLLLDVRLPARRRPRVGGGRQRARAASCSAAPPGARRSTARACSTRTATATSRRR